MCGDVVGELGEVVGVERVRAVAERGLRIAVDLDDDAVGADGGGGARQRLDEPAVAAKRQDLGFGRCSVLVRFSDAGPR